MLRGNCYPRSPYRTSESWSNSFVTQWVYVILSQISLIQLFKFKTWETRLFKMPRLGLPRLQTRHQIRVAFGHCFPSYSYPKSKKGGNFWAKHPKRLNKRTPKLDLAFLSICILAMFLYQFLAQFQINPRWQRCILRQRLWRCRWLVW